MKFDIVIIGSGIAGATAAIALAKQTSLSIAVVEAKQPLPYEAKKNYHYRVSAISPASKNILENLGVWSSIQQKRISSYQKMCVWDAQGQGEIHFDCNTHHQNELGYIIEDNVIRSSLLEQFSQHSNIHFLCPLKLIALQENEDHIELSTDDNKKIIAKLVIAADGANSWVREQTHIEIKSWDYQHTAIVATVKTELSHQATAWQRFLPGGPLAFLPLNDQHHCSIVWSASHNEAEHLMSLEENHFNDLLAEAFDHRLGKILATHDRHSFPLRMRHAKNYVHAHLALIGDAAHTIHPLAGQGINLGMLDAATLVEIIIAAQNQNRDFSSLATLRRYERWRKTDVVAMLAIVEGLKHLFASENYLIKTMRNAGLNFSNRAGLIKHFFVDYAAGKRGDMPELAT